MPDTDVHEPLLFGYAIKLKNLAQKECQQAYNNY